MTAEPGTVQNTHSRLWTAIADAFQRGVANHLGPLDWSYWWGLRFVAVHVVNHPELITAVHANRETVASEIANAVQILKDVDDLTTLNAVCRRLEAALKLLRSGEPLEPS